LQIGAAGGATDAKTLIKEDNSAFVGRLVQTGGLTKIENLFGASSRAVNGGILELTTGVGSTQANIYI
jgi:hypothetical protein